MTDATPSQPVQLLVIGGSDSFEQLWGELADRLGARLELLPPDETASPLPSGPVILNCAGREADAVEALRAVLAAGLSAPIVVGAEADHHLAVELMRRGAVAYYSLPADAARLEADLERRIEFDRSAAERTLLDRAERAAFDFDSIIGEDESLKHALDMAARSIPAGRATVLITGETGTGKELVAQAIHSNGPRASQPFVAVNCSAIPANLLESELFGHERGAFTDARNAKPGLFELADRGTLFLDELSLLPLELQGKLLRVLETREVRRLGGMTAKTIDVRILAAANANLKAMLAQGTLREDLYYRLAVLTVHLPPLRDRGGDVLLLADHFLSVIARDYAFEPAALSAEGVEALRSHAWPGNIRELRNAIERGLLLAGGGEIGPRHLALEEKGVVGVEPSTGAASIAPSAHGSESTAIGPGALPFPAPLAAIERAAARLAVDRAGGNKSEAARLLGITRTRLYRLLDES